MLHQRPPLRRFTTPRLALPMALAKLKAHPLVVAAVSLGWAFWTLMLIVTSVVVSIFVYVLTGEAWTFIAINGCVYGCVAGFAWFGPNDWRW